MKIAVLQLDPTVGALGANVDALADAARAAAASGAELVIAPELAVCGYPPRDLLDRPAFIRDAVAALGALCERVNGPPLIAGAVVGAGADPLVASERIANGAVVIRDGEIAAVHRKILLPAYDVFDEDRYFTAGESATVVEVAGTRIGLSVCEDAWNDKDYWATPRYARDPVAELVDAGAEVIVNISASPYDRDKPAERLRMLRAASARHRRPLIYVNQVGGNDSLLFDGRSFGLDAGGELRALCPAFRVHHSVWQLDGASLTGEIAGAVPTPEDWHADVADALSLGIRDYLGKCGFEHAVIGLSGGIDSALTAALAVRALGPERVIGVTMPSRYSSEGAAGDAHDLGERLKIRVDTVPIEPMFQSFLDALHDPFAGMDADVTEENLQARIRGTVLMAYSNKLGSILLTTGNKSELAVGYATLYGDMAGGLAVISDLYKTDVYALARWLNAHEGDLIPESTLTKPPSAELREDQTDQDSLPPYDDLDAVLRGYVDRALGQDALIDAGHDAELVRRVVRLVDRAEYKRRQMAPGLRVTRKAFGEGRRLPIAQGYSA